MNDDTDRVRRPRRRRWWWLAAALPVALAVAVAVALPWWLGTRSGRAWLLGRANRALAPGRLELATIRFSWFGPTRMTGAVLRDRQGDAVLSAPRASLDRNLWQLLWERPKFGTLRLDRAAVDAERLRDGSIDLYETLRPVIGRDPRTALVIRLPDGRLRFRGDGLLQPVTADHADVTLTITPVPGPFAWRVRLAGGPSGKGAGTLAIDGQYLRGVNGGRGVTDVEVRVVGGDWPWAIGKGGFRASGRLDGTVEAAREVGRWRVKGDAAIGQLVATAPWLAGDSLTLDHVKGVWDVADTESGLSVRRLDVDSPLASLKAESATRLDGRVDLAALAAQLPHALRLKEGVTLDKGTADLRVESGMDEGTAVVDVSGKVSDLVAHDGGRSFSLKSPATLSARLRRGETAYGLERLAAETPYFRGEARGDLASGVTFDATLDLAGFQKEFAHVVDFGRAELAGKGELRGSYRSEGARYRGEWASRFRDVRLAGVGPADLARERVTWSGSVGGPAGPSGRPSGWDRADSKWESGAWTAGLSAERPGPRVSASVAGPLAVGAYPSRAAVAFDVAGAGGAYQLNEVRVRVEAVDKENAPPPLTLRAEGSFDPKAGSLTLRPSRRAGPPDPVALGDDGLTVSGLGTGSGFRADGGLVGDLAALARWAPSAPDGLRGRWAAKASGRSADDGTQLAARLDVAGLSWGDAPPDSPGEALALAVRGFAPKGGEKVDLSELVVTSRFAKVQGSGAVDDPRGAASASLSGTVAPNWEALTDWLGAHVEPRAQVAGRPHPFRVRVPLGGSWRDGLDGEAGVTIDSADVYGMRLGPTRVVARSRDGALTIDPVDTAVNEGRVHLEPAYRAGDDSLGPAVLLKKGTELTGAKVNDEVSRRVLSFVAPVLNNATRVNGLVSASIDEAVFPLRPDDRRSVTVKGEVVFQDVRFSPGGAFRDLLAGVGKQDVALLRIDEPVSLEIADRRVYQRGLVIPVGRISQVEMDGYVGFDRDLNLRVSVPILPTILADKPVVGGIAANSRVRIPIRGTLDDPQIDKEAFKVGMKELGTSVLEEGLGQGAADLFRLLTRPRDPNAPPPLTPAERRARRQERRQERRMNRGLPP